MNEENITIKNYNLEGFNSEEYNQILKNLSYKDRIDFDKKSHTYYINDEPYNVSVTKFIHQFFPKFNAKSIIEKYYEQWQNNPNSKYFGMKKEDISKYWNNLKKDAAFNGTILHAEIEQFYENKEYQKEKPKFRTDMEEIQQFLNFFNDNINLKPIKTEFIIYDKEIKLAGSIDIIYYDTKKKNVYIYDWKRSNEIKDTSFEYGFFPLSHLPNSNFWHYSLQLNLYKWMIEKNFNVKIDSLNLVVFNKNKSNYEIINLPNLKDEVEMMILERMKELGLKNIDLEIENKISK